MSRNRRIHWQELCICDIYYFTGIDVWGIDFHLYAKSSGIKAVSSWLIASDDIVKVKTDLILRKKIQQDLSGTHFTLCL